MIFVPKIHYYVFSWIDTMLAHIKAAHGTQSPCTAAELFDTPRQCMIKFEAGSEARPSNYHRSRKSEMQNNSWYSSVRILSIQRTTSVTRLIN